MLCGRLGRVLNVGVVPEKGVMLHSCQRHLPNGYDYMGKRYLVMDFLSVSISVSVSVSDSSTSITCKIV